MTTMARIKRNQADLMLSWSNCKVGATAIPIDQA